MCASFIFVELVLFYVSIYVILFFQARKNLWFNVIFYFFVRGRICAILFAMKDKS
jgi:hypothetical protein